MYIVAEIGVNHDGSLEKAIKLIEAAKYCGCDAVKFQSFYAKNLVHKSAKKVEYQLRSGNKNESHFDMIRKLEFNGENFKKAFNYAEKLKIDFITTPYDPFSAREAYSLGVRKFKTASADLCDLYLHDQLSKLEFIDIFIATGMADINMIQKTISSYLKSKPVILHCVSDYPCSDSSLNLACLKLFIRNFPGYAFGFSDHSVDNLASIVAATLGYDYFERHFTLNKSDDGPDHYASSNVSEMKAYVENLRRIEGIIGDEIKVMQSEEIGMSKRSKKAIVAKIPLSKGQILDIDNTYAIRPAENGISVDNLDKVLGKELLLDVDKDTFIQTSFLR